jgi:TonB family protein
MPEGIATFARKSFAWHKHLLLTNVRAVFTLATMITKVCLLSAMLISGLASAYGQAMAAPISLAPWVLHAKLTHEVDPEYPTVAGEKRVEGDAFVDVMVDETGKVQTAKQVNCLGCSSILGDAAVAAVKQWVYQPTMVNEKPVPVSSWVAFRFRSAGQPAIEILTRSESSTPPAEPPQVTAPRKIRVSSGVAAGLLIHKVDPDYPLNAKMNHIQGDVVIQCTMSKEGETVEARIVSGDPQLAQSALEAVKQWKYKPFLLNGDPVEVETTVTIKFHLSP